MKADKISSTYLHCRQKAIDTRWELGFPHRMKNIKNGKCVSKYKSFSHSIISLKDNECLKQK